MKSRTKIWLIVAASLVLIGGILFASVMMSLGGDFAQLSTSKYETNKYKITEEFKNISVLADTADIVFLPAEDATTSITAWFSTRMIALPMGDLAITRATFGCYNWEVVVVAALMDRGQGCYKTSYNAWDLPCHNHVPLRPRLKSPVPSQCFGTFPLLPSPLVFIFTYF